MIFQLPALSMSLIKKTISLTQDGTAHLSPDYSKIIRITNSKEQFMN